MDALKGSVLALFFSFLVALVFAYIFRIPIPLVGMLGPLGAFSPYTMDFTEVLTSVFVAWVFYGMFGGFLILPLFGALAGQWASRKFPRQHDKDRMVILYTAIAGTIPVTCLSILDYIIGPW
jgi:hypothetical protein